MRIMPPVEAYNEDLFRDVLKAFDNLDERANERGNAFYNNYPADEYTDPVMSENSIMVKTQGIRHPVPLDVKTKFGPVSRAM
jgi:hypothetical protein